MSDPKQRLIITVEFRMDDEKLSLEMESDLEEVVKEAIEDYEGEVDSIEFRGERPS